MNEPRHDADEIGAYAAGESTPTERFESGYLLASRYRIVAPLGKGGMGEVYRADDLTLAQPVALKFLPAHLANDLERLARFRKEVASARKVSHPNGTSIRTLSGDVWQTGKNGQLPNLPNVIYFA
jgi:serine/threonine protein kinase